jgi:type I restriction enzyme S subunit
MIATSLPKDWGRRRLRFDARLNPVKSELALSGDAEVSFVPMDAVGELGGLRLDEQRIVDDVCNGYTYFRNGDVVIAKITPCFENGKGSTAAGLTNGVAFGTTELHVVRPSDWLDGHFFFYATIAHDFRSFGESEMLGAGSQKRVPERFLKDWQLPLPPLETQKRIAAFLDEKMAQIDTIRLRVDDSVSRLHEYRSALITAAVTGQIEGLC